MTKWSALSEERTLTSNILVALSTGRIKLRNKVMTLQLILFPIKHNLCENVTVLEEIWMKTCITGI